MISVMVKMEAVLLIMTPRQWWLIWPLVRTSLHFEPSSTYFDSKIEEQEEQEEKEGEMKEGWNNEILVLAEIWKV